MQRRFTPIALIIAFVAMFWCGLLVPSHACCAGLPEAASLSAMAPSTDPSGEQPSMAACCQPKALVFSGTDWQDSPAKIFGLVTAAPALLAWTQQAGPLRRVVEQSAFVKDNSRRHLELSVLLN